jgi:hypothetical protein
MPKFTPLVDADELSHTASAAFKGRTDMQLSRHDLVGSDIVAEQWHFVTCGRRCFSWTTLRDERNIEESQ